MSKFIAAISAISGLAVVACSPMAADPEPAPLPPVGSVEASLADGYGAYRGTARLTQVDQGIRVVIDVQNMPPGVKAAHIHTTGRCDGPDFQSAGGHWNPYDRQHGRENPQGQHMGDMPNLIVGQDGTGHLEVTITDAWIEGGRAPLLDDDGAAVMIHAGPDDYRSDPAGDAGSRIACGVITPVG